MLCMTTRSYAATSVLKLPTRGGAEASPYDIAPSCSVRGAVPDGIAYMIGANTVASYLESVMCQMDTLYCFSRIQEFRGWAS